MFCSTYLQICKFFYIKILINIRIKVHLDSLTSFKSYLPKNKQNMAIALHKLL